MIERIHLKILREIERQGSLTAAAQSLHLTQSALSHSIKKLELQIDTALWVKEGRQLELTPAGKYLLREAKRLLPQLEQIDNQLALHASGEQGTLRVGMECYPCYQWLLTVTEAFLNAYPDVDVDVKQRFQFGGMAALINHEIDLLVTPDPLSNDKITFTPVFGYEQVLIMSKDNALAQKPYILPEDLINQTLYTYPIEKERLDIYSLFLSTTQSRPKQRKTIEDTKLILQLVATNRGVATLPLWLVEQYQTKLAITSLRLGKKGIHKSIHLGMRNNDNHNVLATNFINIANRQLKNKSSR